jgi:hypothetical protein
LADAQAGQSFAIFDMASKEWESQQFVFLDLDNEEKLLVKERNFIPHILDWPTRTVPWWRSQTTRCAQFVCVPRHGTRLTFTTVYVYRYIVRPLPSLLAWTKAYFNENLRR